MRKSQHTFQAATLALLLILPLSPLLPADDTPADPRILEALPIDRVWAGHPVGFALYTHKDRQFVAYWNADRQLEVASRSIGSDQWRHSTLPETIQWDSHNYITLHVDSDEYIHLAGNMHVDPLRYYRSTQPLDLHSLRRALMVGRDEDRTTYPRFIDAPGGRLLFRYRDGESGDGNDIYNAYDPATKQWTRWLEQPLTDGLGQCNAYVEEPHLGPDGYYHLVWVWRDTPDCATNHDVSYARSPDLRNWQRSDGTTLSLPITPDNAEIVAPVPVHGGLINGSVKVGWDHQDRSVLTYMRYDDEDNSQIYLARREDDGWRHVQVSDWNWRWNFSGGGSIHFAIRTAPLKKHPDGKHLILDYYHDHHGERRWILDPDSLKPLRDLPRPDPIPAALKAPRSEWPDMRVHLVRDEGRPPAGDERFYLLRWETLDSNRDLPREGPLPPPQPLMLYAIAHQDSGASDAPQTTPKDQR